MRDQGLLAALHEQPVEPLRGALLAAGRRRAAPGLPGDVDERAGQLQLVSPGHVPVSVRRDRRQWHERLAGEFQRLRRRLPRGPCRRLLPQERPMAFRQPGAIYLGRLCHPHWHQHGDPLAGRPLLCRLLQCAAHPDHDRPADAPCVRPHCRRQLQRERRAHAIARAMADALVQLSPARLPRGGVRQLELHRHRRRPLLRAQARSAAEAVEHTGHRHALRPPDHL